MTATAERPRQQPNGGQVAVTSPAERTISFVPLGEKTAIDLTIGMVRTFLAVRTRSGATPSDQDIVKFMMLCKARELNPWVGDAYLTGYDSSDGPTFSLITSHQALLKRAEISQAYDGMESGVVLVIDKEVIHREGDLVLDGETIVGGWARAYRKDRAHPSYDSLKLSVYSTGKSRWAKDPAGMIVKCAEASALRKAFPTQLGGLYTQEEMEHLSNQRIDNREHQALRPTSLAALEERLGGLPEKAPAPTPAKEPEPQHIEDVDQRQPGDDTEPTATWDQALTTLYETIDAEKSHSRAVDIGAEAKSTFPPEYHERIDQYTRNHCATLKAPKQKSL